MRTVRAILVVLTSLSLALLPVAGVAAPAADSISAHADCCPMDGDCGKHSKGNCTDDAACALKCAGVSAIPLASAETASVGNASAELTPVLRLNLSLAPNPPSPPPRA